MTPWARIGLAAAVVAVLLLSSLSAIGSPASERPVPSEPLNLASSAAAGATAPARSPAAPFGAGPSTAASTQFDQRARETAAALASAGVPSSEVRLPYVGRSAEVVDGAVVPGYALASENVTPTYSEAPAPSGLAYYGENDSHGTVEATTLDASSVEGTLTVQQMDALYLDVDTPDMWGIQLNAVLGDVTLGGVSGYQFWVQNAVDVFEHNDTINLGEDTWNFSNPSAYIAYGSSTILSHSPNGSVIAGLYIGEGPWIHAPLPWTLSLYVNSSETAAGDQELWYNYSVSAAGGLHRAGNYDWVIFRSAGGSGPTPVAPFVASGEKTSPVGLPNDFEFDFGIGGYNGATMDVLAANLSASLRYCAISYARCTPGEMAPVPAATDFGSETGETSSGLYVGYSGTTAHATAGPFLLRGLWGYSGATGSTAGSVAVENAIAVSGDPDTSGGLPYVFVFLEQPGLYDNQYEWAPDVPVWHLAPGTYRYHLMLADYMAQTGSFTVGGSGGALSADLLYSSSSGVYTPLWAFNNSALAGISTQGTGSLVDQYLLFSNPTADCVDCGNAVNGNLSSAFASADDYDFPTFVGILLVGTTAYTEIDHPVSFCVYSFLWGLVGAQTTSVYFDLQIQFVSTEHVTLDGATHLSGWPAMFETQTLAGVVNASQNPFPQAVVMIWNSTGDLIASNTFVPTITVPAPTGAEFGVAPALYCYGCVSPDGLLLYGGSGNTVWGNIFHDPKAAPADDPLTVYAGLAEAENGDLVYNNNFSIDNPTVYLPFDIYTDACPDGYAGDCGPLVPPNYDDTWNVTPQPSVDVSATVNDVALSGNVLGGGCAEQGGNFWIDYGNSRNPMGQLPFVNRYNYSEIQGLLPPGSSAVQPSIRVGGDYAPLLRSGCGTEPVRFFERGLPAQSTWELEVDNGSWLVTSTAWINVSVPPGNLTFRIAGPASYGVARITGPHHPTYNSATVSGREKLIVHFGLLEPLFFNETVRRHWPGLPSGAEWNVTISPRLSGGPPTEFVSTTGAQIVLTVPHGAWIRFFVQAPAGYESAAAHGGFEVPAHPVVRLVKFRADPDPSSASGTPFGPAGSPALGRFLAWFPSAGMGPSP